MREKALFLVPFNRRPWKKIPDDPPRGTDVTHHEDGTNSAAKFLQRVFLPLRTSLGRFKPVFEPIQPYFGREDPPTEDGSVKSGSEHSTGFDTQASVSSDSRAGSIVSASRRSFGRFLILVRGNEDVTPAKAEGMYAWLDTGCVKNLMDWRHFARLEESHKIRLEPSDVDIVTLNGKRMKVHGIARGLLWGFCEGFKTYKSDFYVLKMDLFDALVGWETIFEYDLLQLGVDPKLHLDKTREKDKSRRKLLREIKKTFAAI
ncbi:hypothetical protein BJX62DRAFT_207740 [Aspergillus germanicus]